MSPTLTCIISDCVRLVRERVCYACLLKGILDLWMYCIAGDQVKSRTEFVAM